MPNFPLNSRVALRNGADTIYKFAFPGTEGWAREYKCDDDGFEMIRVEWDKTHWRYAGQPDGWTFANHFEIIGPPELKKPIIEEEPILEELPEPTPIVELANLSTSEDETERYIDMLTDAMDAASELDGFVVLAIRRVPNPENNGETMFIPAVFQYAISPEASMLLDVQIAEIASANLSEMVMNIIQSMGNDS